MILIFFLFHSIIFLKNANRFLSLIYLSAFFKNCAPVSWIKIFLGVHLFSANLCLSFSFMLFAFCNYLEGLSCIFILKICFSKLQVAEWSLLYAKWMETATTALIWPLAWELQYAMNTILKRQKKILSPSYLKISKSFLFIQHMVSPFFHFSLTLGVFHRFFFWLPCSIWSSQARNYIWVEVVIHAASAAMLDPLTHCTGLGIKPASWCYRDPWSDAS